MRVKHLSECYLQKVTYLYHMYKESLRIWQLAPIMNLFIACFRVYVNISKICRVFWAHKRPVQFWIAVDMVSMRNYKL